MLTHTIYMHIARQQKTIRKMYLAWNFYLITFYVGIFVVFSHKCFPPYERFMPVWVFFFFVWSFVNWYISKWMASEDVAYQWILFESLVSKLYHIACQSMKYWIVCWLTQMKENKINRGDSGFWLISDRIFRMRIIQRARSVKKYSIHTAYEICCQFWIRDAVCQPKTIPWSFVFSLSHRMVLFWSHF